MRLEVDVDKCAGHGICESIADDAFAASFDRVRQIIESAMASGALAAHPTFFECLTAMAFDAQACATARTAPGLPILRAISA